MDKIITILCATVCEIACCMCAICFVIMFDGMLGYVMGTLTVISGVLIWDAVFPPKKKEGE